MDKRKSILNVSVSVALKLMLLVCAIAGRRLVIDRLGSGINGLNSLYLNLIDTLALAELGVGEAVTYCMYEPATRGETQRLSALFFYFKKLYRIIAGVIFIAGLLVVPSLRRLAVGCEALGVNLSLTFLLMLLSVCITYFYGAETALLNAHKNNYIATAVTSGGKLLQYLLQMAVLASTGSYVGFLVCRILSSGAQWAAARWLACRRYSAVILRRQEADTGIKRTVGRNVSAMFLHKLGAVVVNSTDGILISAFVGVTVLGKYSNYTAIMTSMTGVLGLIFSSLTSTVGHLYVQKSTGEVRRHFERFYSLNHMLGAVFFLGYYAVIDLLVALLFGRDLQLDRGVTLMLTLSYFIRFTRRAVLLFRDATGTFYHDRWKPALESVVNLVVSLVLGRQMGISGILLGTVITDLTICSIAEPRVLYRNVFKRPAAGFILKNYGFILLFAAALMLLDRLLAGVTGFFARGLVSIAVSGVLCLGILTVSPRLFGAIRKNGRHINEK